MGRRTRYAAGTFSWVDLATTDIGAAEAFYSGVFGWNLDREDAGGGAVYTTCRLDGDAVCGLFEISEDRQAAGVPPNWMSYVTVDAADAATARAEELGGVVIDAAFDVLDVGRMAVLEDPQGAVFAVWQPRRRIGAERVNDVGCLCMNELATTDIEAARAFYERLFDWTIEVADTAPAGPHMVLNGGHVNAAVFATPEEAPPHWRPCFTVESTEKAVERVRELGGQQVGDALELDHGSIAMVRDPQGARFTVFAGDTEP